MELDAFTIAVAGATGAATLLIGWRRPFVVLTALVLLVPFRDFATRWMNVHSGLSVQQVTALGRWWFAVVAALLLLSTVRWSLIHRAARRPPSPGPTDILLGVVLVWGVMATLISPASNSAFTSFRGYVQPLMVFLLARLVRPKRQELRLLVVLWLVVGLLMAAFALVQVAAWDEATFRAEGYVRQDGSLVVPYSTIGERRYLRPASTVSGPNELGLDMVLLLLLAGFAAVHAIPKLRAPLVGLMLVLTGAMALSVSRSAFLGLMAAALAAAALSRGRLFSSLRRMPPRARTRATVVGLAGLAAVVAIFGAAGMLSVVSRTVTNLTRAYHFVDSAEAFQFLVQHPQGVGMGLVEPKGALTLIEAGGTYHVEGSLFQIAMEMGVWGLAAWLAFWGAALARIYRNFHALRSAELRVLTGTAFAGWLGSLVAFLFLPLMQSISLMVWLWFLLGVGYQSLSIEAAWEAATPAAVES